MKEKRATFLMAIMLVLLAGYLLKSQLNYNLYQLERSTESPKEPPLAENNKISNLQISKNMNGTYTAKFEYFYRGEPEPAWLSVQAEANQTAKKHFDIAPVKLERGAHTVEVEVPRPTEQEEVTTKKITVSIVAFQQTQEMTAASTEIDYAIEWPNLYTYLNIKQSSAKSIEELYSEAVNYIDQSTGESLRLAKHNLEQILLNKPNYVPAYSELARIAMKTSWGPEGLGQAEKYLKSALELDAKHANTKVLLGYVYTHQKRYKEAEDELAEAANIGTTNSWLWANWGELLLVQKKDNLALEKYLHIIESNRTYDTNDRARLDAYAHIFMILEKQKLFDKMDSFYQKRADEFGKYPCFFADYALFRITHYGDHESGISNSKKAIDSGCNEAYARNILGISFYMAWSVLSGNEKNIAITQARVFLPEGPRLFYELARNEKTSKVIAKLIENGSSLSEQDNEKLSALAYALIENDIDAAKRLIGFGAKFDELVGHDQYPVAIIAFYNQNVKAIALMQETGVDFINIKFNGMNAVEYAKRLNNKAILEIVVKKRKYLL
jgi:hypothetical protein